MTAISWDTINGSKQPSIEEVVRATKEEPVLFPLIETISDGWISLSQIYRALFSAFFLRKTGLDRLDRRLAERGFTPVPEKERRFFHRYDSLGLDYFYLRTMAKVERLSAEELETLQNAKEEGTEASSRKRFVWWKRHSGAS